MDATSREGKPEEKGSVYPKYPPPLLINYNRKSNNYRVEK